MKIGDAIATMAMGRPNDLDPEGWFEAAIWIDQACATNTAFRESLQPAPAIPEVILSEELLPPTPSDVLDIKGMSVDDIQMLWQQLFGTLEEFPAIPMNTEEVHTLETPTLEAPTTPPTSSTN